MRKLFLFANLLLVSIAFAQTTETAVQTSIQSVLVKRNTAQISSSGKVQLGVGRHVVKFKQLAIGTIETSIQLRSAGEFSIISTQLEEVSIESILKSSEVLQKTAIQTQLNRKRQELYLLLDALNVRRNTLNSNITLQAKENPKPTATLQEFSRMFEQEVLEIGKTKLRTEYEIASIDSLLNKNNLLLDSIYNTVHLKTKSYVAEIQVIRPITEFSLDYETEYAQWFPRYDIRVSSIQSPLIIEHKALISQTTGVDWKSVPLTISNANSSPSLIPLDLDNWTLYPNQSWVSQRKTKSITSVSGKIIDSKGEPIPFATIVIPDESIGTISDVNGNYTLTHFKPISTISVSMVGYEVQTIGIYSSKQNVTLYEQATQLESVMIMSDDRDYEAMPSPSIAAGADDKMYKKNKAMNQGYGRKDNYQSITENTQIESQIDVQYAFNTPQTLLSKGNSLILSTAIDTIPAIYQYQIIPKLQKEVQLEAKIPNWSTYTILTGTASLFYENSFTANTVLTNVVDSDTLTLTLGIDNGVLVNRKVLKQTSKKALLGGNITETRTIQIRVQNTKSIAIPVQVTDQIPISIRSDVEVKLEDSGKGKLNKDTGKLNWNMQIPAKSSQVFEFTYVVKYPQGLKIFLD